MTLERLTVALCRWYDRSAFSCPISHISIFYDRWRLAWRGADFLRAAAFLWRTPLDTAVSIFACA